MSSTFCFISADINYFFDTNVPMVLATHSAEDVGIWARGPMAHLFHGTHEQSYIAHVMMYASCVGPNQEHCENRAMSTPSSSPSPVTSETRETSSPSQLLVKPEKLLLLVQLLVKPVKPEKLLLLLQLLVKPEKLLLLVQLLVKPEKLLLLVQLLVEREEPQI